MGKTYRFAHEDEDYGRQDHRIRRRDIIRANAEMAIYAEQLLPKIVRPPQTPRWIKTGWIMSGYDLDQRQEYIRQTRLDLIQAIGEQMLAETSWSQAG